MPQLNTNMHINMMKSRNPDFETYGLEWGDPGNKEEHPQLFNVKKNLIDPYINPGHTALEIGPGGGRWTRYILDFKTLYMIDYHNELLSELKKNYNKPNMVFIKNNGTDFPGVPDNSIDFLFTFGTFVHLDLNLIDEYLHNIKRITHNQSNIIIQYSDKTKELAKKNVGFSENDPQKMRDLSLKHGYKIINEDLNGNAWSVIHINPNE